MAPEDSSLLHQVPEDVLGKIHNTHTLAACPCAVHYKTICHRMITALSHIKGLLPFPALFLIHFLNRKDKKLL